MRFSALHLQQFRSYQDASVTLPAEPGCVVLLGENGAGKTNLLEALSVLSLTRSCRGREEVELVSWGKEFYRLRSDVTADDGAPKRVEVVSELLPRRRKACFVNDVRTSAGEFVGIVPTVTFLPQDLLLFSGPPAERRRFLDQLLSQVSPAYMVSLSGYQQVLQQRNALLKSIAAGEGSPETLVVWDLELARLGSEITLARLGLIETLALSFGEEVASLGEQWSDVTLKYERKTTATKREELAEELRMRLLANRDREIAAQSTLSGPHREDWQVNIAGRDLPTFASRGQERTAVLALLFLQVSYLELTRGEMPVLLLDDACSELDDRHQEKLLSGFPGAQVLLTATRLPPNTTNLIATYHITPGAITAA